MSKIKLSDLDHASGGLETPKIYRKFLTNQHNKMFLTNEEMKGMLYE